MPIHFSQDTQTPSLTGLCFSRAASVSALIKMLVRQGPFEQGLLSLFVLRSGCLLSYSAYLTKPIRGIDHPPNTLDLTNEGHCNYTDFNQVFLKQ